MPNCPICKTVPPCEHLQERTEPVVHYRIPPEAFSSDTQLVGYLSEIMHYAKTSELALGSELYEHLQVFMMKHSMPYDFHSRKPKED